MKYLTIEITGSGPSEDLQNKAIMAARDVFQKKGISFEDAWNAHSAELNGESYKEEHLEAWQDAVKATFTFLLEYENADLSVCDI
jgi:hypothetical protein